MKRFTEEGRPKAGSFVAMCHDADPSMLPQWGYTDRSTCSGRMVKERFKCGIQKMLVAGDFQCMQLAGGSGEGLPHAYWFGNI